jgi:adenosine deaminase
VVSDMRKHPLRKMLHIGLKATINSDDPAYFGCYINENYKAVTAALGLGKDDLLTVVRNSIEGSFLGPIPKAALRSKLDNYGQKAP